MNNEYVNCVVSADHNLLLVESKHENEAEAEAEAAKLNGTGPKFFWPQRVPVAMIERLAAGEMSIAL